MRPRQGRHGPSQVSCVAEGLAAGASGGGITSYRKFKSSQNVKRAVLHASPNDNPSRHRTARCTLRRRPVEALRAKRHTSLQYETPAPCAARAAPEPKGGAGSGSAVVEGLGAQARLASVGWPCRAPAHRQGQCSVRPCVSRGEAASRTKAQYCPALGSPSYRPRSSSPPRSPSRRRCEPHRKCNRSPRQAPARRDGSALNSSRAPSAASSVFPPYVTRV